MRDVAMPPFDLTDTGRGEARYTEILVRHPRGRMARAVGEAAIWIAAVAAFVMLEVAFAIGLLTNGVSTTHAELLLGLSAPPLYLVVRRVWRRARASLLPTAMDLAFSAARPARGLSARSASGHAGR